jgi:hypothetical protein
LIHLVGKRLVSKVRQVISVANDAYSVSQTRFYLIPQVLQTVKHEHQSKLRLIHVLAPREELANSAPDEAGARFGRLMNSMPKRCKTCRHLSGLRRFASPIKSFDYHKQRHRQCPPRAARCL